MEDKGMRGFDEALDRALAGYCLHAGPGLEARVLEHVLRTESMRRGRRAFVMSSIALAASLLVFVLIQHKPAQIQPRANEPAIAVVGVDQTRAQQVTMQRVRHRKARTRIRQLVKRSIFPSATPVTAQEQALLQLIRQGPEAADALASLQQETQEPLHVEALNIAPLSQEQGVSGGNQ